MPVEAYSESASINKSCRVRLQYFRSVDLTVILGQSIKFKGDKLEVLLDQEGDSIDAIVLKTTRNDRKT